MSLLSEFFPPHPQFTEKDLPDQTGKVFIVTGGASGVGYELVKMIYEKNGTVYIATRSVVKINSTIESIRKLCPSSKGRLESMVLDFSDLTSIKPAVDRFLAKEKRLDVLFHNAGVMATPVDRRTVQGHELQLGTNIIGPFLLTRLLEPTLISTAHQCERGSVRIVWVATGMGIGTAPKGGIVWDSEEDRPSLLKTPNDNYFQSKAGMIFIAHEYAQRLGKEGIVSVSLHPGLMKTELQRHMSGVVRGIMSVVFKEPIYGAYTEIFGGFSPEVKSLFGGGYLIAWGRIGSLPTHLNASMAPKKPGEKAYSRDFWDWCEKVTSKFAK